jgi:hypothetical protein
MMIRLAAALAVVLVGALAMVAGMEGDDGSMPALVRSANAASFAAPPGLSAYGRRVWNLEALLRDTFGVRTVYVEGLGRQRGRINFTTRFTANCCSAYWHFTFLRARGSAFKRVALPSPLPPAVGVSGGELPITVKRQYVYCGSGRWLYYHYGNGPANFQIDCWKP